MNSGDISVANRKIAIGYLWQHESADMNRGTAAVLHINAVAQGLRQKDHHVRMVTFQDGRHCWSDDLTLWHQATLGASDTRSYRLTESLLRGAQRRLGLPFLRLFDSYRFSDACVSALIGFDVLYERHWLLASGGIIAAQRLGIPVILEVNGDIIEEYRQLGIRLSQAQWAVIDVVSRSMFARASAVITVSDTLKQRIAYRWQVDPRKIHVVHNGSHVDLFANPNESAAARWRSLIGGVPAVAFVGAFQPWHGIDLLVHSFSRIARAGVEAKLILVGDGPVRPDLEQLVSDLRLTDRVVFTGKLPHPEVAAVLSAVEVAIVNPRATGATVSQSPLKLFEYMAAGKAIVAPAIPTIEKLLGHRTSALLIPPDDVESLAAAQIELLRDARLRLALGNAAQQQALARHSWDHVTTELESIIWDLAKRRVT